MKLSIHLSLLALICAGFCANSAQAQEDNLPYVQKYPFERALTGKDLEETTSRERRLIRNAIYARHGRPFADADLSKFFGAQSWYKRDANWKASDETTRLSATEKRNAEFVAQTETNYQNASYVRHRLIKPGQSVGDITLGMSRAKVLKLWGKAGETQKRPDKMSQDCYYFEGTHNRMALSAATLIYRADKVAQIQITAGEFATADKISTSNSLGKIRQTIKPLKRLSYSFPVADGGLAIYDNKTRGISFVFYVDIEEEDASSKPFEIIVHPANKPIIPIAREAFGHGFQLSRLSK